MKVDVKGNPVDKVITSIVAGYYCVTNNKTEVVIHEDGNDWEDVCVTLDSREELIQLRDALNLAIEYNWLGGLKEVHSE